MTPPVDTRWRFAPRSNPSTGEATDTAMATKVRPASPTTPIYIDSGVPVDPERVRAFVKTVKG